jgi:hypothetical protein
MGIMGCVDAVFVRRELVEVAQIDRPNGHRKKAEAAEYDEPMRKRENVNHPLREHGHILGLPIEIGVVGSASIANRSRFGVGSATAERNEETDECRGRKGLLQVKRGGAVRGGHTQKCGITV